MNKMKSIILGSCVGLLFITSAQATDARFPTKPYRAEAVVTSKGVSTSMVMYSSGRKMRIEIDTGDTDAVQIIDFDSNKAFMLINANGQKIATKIDTKNIIEKMGLNNIDLGRSTGKKRIAKTSCKTYKIKEATVCLTAHDITLENISPEGTMRVTKLNLGTQKTSLFEVPSGYKVMDLGAMSGIDANTFDSKDNILAGILGGAGLKDNSGSLTQGINNIVNAGDDDDAAAQATMDMVMGKMGFKPGTITTKDTTTGLLNGAINSGMSDADRQKDLELKREADRVAKLIKEDGMMAMFIEMGMSEEDIRKMQESRAKMNKLSK